ncbi:hypothetical protein [Streptomyces lydicus]|uniref:hypothetical protein n=1 Tax=Streptomyces lydicus TaxID=47763 RepID=UPI0037BBCAC1
MTANTSAASASTAVTWPYYARPDLSWVPLTDVEPLRVALAWYEGAPSPLVGGFAEVVRELAAALREDGTDGPGGARGGAGPATG